MIVYEAMIAREVMSAQEAMSAHEAMIETREEHEAMTVHESMSAHEAIFEMREEVAFHEISPLLGSSWGMMRFVDGVMAHQRMAVDLSY